MTTDWVTPSAPPSLPAEELHIWRVPLSLSDGAVSVLSHTLAPDERARADRFRLPHDRRRFVAARGSLRTLLGQILSEDPAELVFAYGPQGKPSLASPQSAQPFAFNVSHSGDLALVAMRWGTDVGIDIEWIREGWEWEAVAKRLFCDAEIAWLRALPDHEQHSGFFILWTRKEAYLKARGEGVWHDLSRFDVTYNPVRETGVSREAGTVPWMIEDLFPGSHCQAAICVQEALPTLCTWQWESPGH